jgi:hypothetical protein
MCIYAAFTHAAPRRRQPRKASRARPVAKRVRVEGSGMEWSAPKASGSDDGNVAGSAPIGKFRSIITELINPPDAIP